METQALIAFYSTVATITTTFFAVLVAGAFWLMDRAHNDPGKVRLYRETALWLLAGALFFIASGVLSTMAILFIETASSWIYYVAVMGTSIVGFGMTLAQGFSFTREYKEIRKNDRPINQREYD